MSERFVVGMSGGVDSAVSAYLLKEQGYEVTCIFMKNWEEDSEYCTSEQDYKDALKACDHLNLPLKTVNFIKEYKAKVFDYFLKEYASGRTPNPDTLCNKEIKFKAFLNYAIQTGADQMATGHYAQIMTKKGQYYLKKGTDSNKDQSYFLYMLNQAQLQKTVFPIGKMTKKNVRKIAREIGLPNHDRKDSTGVCFIGERDFDVFLHQYFISNPGRIVTKDGKVVGQHDGLMFYTLGQRQRLRIGGGRGYQEEPWYVIDKNITANELIVGQGRHNPDLYSKQFTVTDLHWISGLPPETTSLSAKIRYRQNEEKCTLTYQNEQVQVEFEKAQFAVTPGQAAVFYDGDFCLGGGTINERNKF